LNLQNNQKGAVLVVGLLLLLVITLIGITNFGTTILEEKMSANFQDKNMVFQAADTAIEDGMEDINFLWAAYDKGLNPATPQTQNVTNSSASFSASKVEAEFEGNTIAVYGNATSMRIGASGYQLFHYSITGTAELGNSNAKSEHVMGAYLKGATPY